MIVRVDLAVRMGDRGTHLWAAVLEDQHVVHVVARAQLLRAVGPQIDHLAGPGNTEGREGGVVDGRVQHDLASAAVHRRPPIREPTDVVRVGGLQTTDAEGTTG